MAPAPPLRLEGPLFALLTPFSRDGSLDYRAMQGYLLFLQERGVRAGGEAVQRLSGVAEIEVARV